MINKSTVLILGAGASKPFGFPLGNELKKRIVDLQDVSEKNFNNSLMNNLAMAGFNYADIVEFARHLGASPFSSVDRFLEYSTVFRGKVREIGCAAIATELLIRSQNLNDCREFNWIGILFNALAPDFDKMRKGCLTVITYNYDCSFEYLLYKGLISTIEPARAKQAFEKIDIIHLHGRLVPSAHPWELQYVSADTIRNSIEPEKGIKIIHEQDHKAGLFVNARLAIKSAERIFFLGFGYDEVNLERLFGSEYPVKPEGKFIAGTAFERTNVENWNVNKKFFSRSFRFGRDDWEIPIFLRKSGAFQEVCSLLHQTDPNG